MSRGRAAQRSPTGRPAQWRLQSPIYASVEAAIGGWASGRPLRHRLLIPGTLWTEVIAMSEENECNDVDTVRGQRFKKLPEVIAAQDMSTAHVVDPPPSLPDSDYDRQERFLRDAAG